MEKRIPSKNYLILTGIIILVICGCFAFYNLYNIYQVNKISESPLSQKEVLYNDLKNSTKDIGADTFLVISYVQNVEVYNNEKEINRYLKKHNLIDNVMYLNVTDYLANDDFIADLNSTLKLKDNLMIKKLPALVYYKENVATYVVDSKDHLLNKNDFEQIIDMYEVE